MTNEELAARQTNNAIGGNDPRRGSDTVTSLLQAILCANPAGTPEIDGIYTNWLPICVAGVQYYVAEKFEHNNSTNTSTFIEKVYKLGAEGVPTAAAPAGVIIQGQCPTSKLDPELICLVPNGSPVGTASIPAIAVYDVSVTPPTTRFYLNSVDVTATHTQVPCSSSDVEVLEKCFQLIATPATKFNRVSLLDTSSGTIVNTIWLDATGAVTATPVAATVESCTTNTPIFAGFVCDNFGGTPAVVGTPPTCTGGPLVTRAAENIVQYTEGPTGTFVPTGGAASLEFHSNDINSPLQGFCEAQFTFDAGVDTDPNSQQFIASYVNNAGNTIDLDAAFVAAIEAQVGGVATQIPSGTVVSATAADGNLVTITYAGPSSTTEALSVNGALFFFEGNNNGASTIKMSFATPVRSLKIQANNIFPNPGSVSGLQAVQATPGTNPIPAQAASVTQVKQFRNTDGTSFYENLNGTVHTVTGTIGRCQQNSPEVLCDVNGIVSTSFLRNYELDTNGQIISFLDTNLQGVPYIPTGIVSSCAVAPPVEPTFEIIELCDTNIVVSGNLVTNGDFTANSTGWILTGNVAHGVDNGPDAVAGVLAFNAVDAIPNGVAFQAVGTTAGIPYVLVFNAGTVGLGADQQEIRVQVIDVATGAILANAVLNPNQTASNTPNWNPTGSATLNFVATGSATELRFTDQSVSPSINKNLLLDKVVLTGSTPVVTKFLRKINSNGTIFNTTNGVTPYVPTGTIGVCDITPEDNCIAPTKIGEICYTTVPAGVTDTAAVMRDCKTGAISYIDISTGANITSQIGTTLVIVPCASTTTPCNDCESTILCDVVTANPPCESGNRITNGDFAVNPGPWVFAPIAGSAWATGGGIAVGGNGGSTGGTMEQSFVTIPGHTYSIVWERGRIASNGIGSGTTVIQRLKVEALNGATVLVTDTEAIPAVNTVPPAGTVMVAGNRTLTFVATGTTSIIRFTDAGDTGGPNVGVVVDNVVITCTSDGNGTHQFLRTICRDCTSVVTSTTDTALNGTTAYVVLGTVGLCVGAESSVETDLVKTNWLPICVAGVQHYVSESSTFNNATNTESAITKLYKQGANGTISTVAPIGTIVEGECECVVKTIQGCFTPTNTLLPTKDVYAHYSTTDCAGSDVLLGYTLSPEYSTTFINVATLDGGGVATIGACPCYKISDGTRQTLAVFGAGDVANLAGTTFGLAIGEQTISQVRSIALGRGLSTDVKITLVRINTISNTISMSAAGVISSSQNGFFRVLIESSVPIDWQLGARSFDTVGGETFQINAGIDTVLDDYIQGPGAPVVVVPASSLTWTNGNNNTPSYFRYNNKYLVSFTIDASNGFSNGVTPIPLIVPAVETVSKCNPVKSLTKPVTHTRVSTTSITQGGLASVNFTAISGTVTVAGATLSAGQTITYSAYFDNATNTFNRVPPIAFNASAGVLDIITQE